MGKITVKHYLNTNLKPYIINGEKYFSIYLLVTVNRQTTKVKSVYYKEYYSEKDFQDITEKTNIEDLEVINNEEITVKNLIEMIIQELSTFDSVLFSCIYNYYQTIHIFDIDIQLADIEGENKTVLKVDLFDKNKNSAGLSLDTLLIKPFSLLENEANGMSLFTWFSNFGQIELRNFLVEENCLMDIEKTIYLLNKIVFFKSFEILNWIVKGSKKFENLNKKHVTLFDNPTGLCEKYYKEFIK